MTHEILFPNKILYTSRLLRVTTIYSVELTEPEFLDLKILFPIEELGIKRGDRLNTIAEKIEDQYGNTLEGINTENADLQKSVDIANAFDYERFGEITIGGYMPGDNGGYTIADGNHRSIALAVLLHCGRIEYQTVTAILAVSKDIAEEIIYEDEVSIPR